MERKIPRRITLTNDSVNPLTEKQIVDATVAYANGTDLVIHGLWPSGAKGHDMRDQEWVRKETGDEKLGAYLQLAEKMRIASLREGKPNPFAIDPSVRITTVQEFRVIFRKRVSEILALALRDPHAASEIMLDGGTIRGLFLTCGVRNSLGKTESGLLRWNTEYTFSMYAELVELGLILMLDERRSFKEKLCQCQWEPCGLFFFEVKPPTGRPQRKYCCSEHLLKAHDENAAKRMKRKRSAPRSKK